MSRLAENIQVNVSQPGSVFLPTTHAQDNTSIEYRVHRSTSQTHCVKHSHHDNNFSETNNGSGPKRSSSGILSFFKWFKKGSELNKSEFDRRHSTSSSSSNSEPNTPKFPLSRNQSAASVDSLFSTATVASFTFVPPAVYNPFGDANAPEKLLAPGPDTDTHRNRMKQLEKHRERDKNITLRKKYKLFSSETIKTKSLDIPNCPEKPKPNPKNKLYVKNREYSELSLPLMKCQVKTMDNEKGNASSTPVQVPTKSHRRTVSDSSKDRKAGAYCHVKGKRKAPAPPVGYLNSKQIETNSLTSPNSTLARKKRQAPPPPAASLNESLAEKSIQCSTNNLDNKQNNFDKELSPSSNLTQEQKNLLITNITRLQYSRPTMENIPPERSEEATNGRSGSSSLNNSIPDVVCNDSLKLEYGVLKSVKETVKPLNTAPENSNTEANRKVATPVSPISPRPWYKRTLSNRDSIGSNASSQFKKEYFKHHSRSEEIEETLPHRYSAIKETNSKLSSVLSRFSISSEERRKDNENRKSGLSMLANISELDREAAMIVQKEQNREQARLDAQNELFYSPSNSETDVPAFLQSQQSQQKSSCKKGSARELISRFNALTNATRISVNSALFSSTKDSDTRNARRFSFQATEREPLNGSKYNKDKVAQSVVTPPMKRSIFNLGGFTDESIKEEEKHIWKPSEIKASFEPKVINAPANIHKYFDVPKTTIEEKSPPIQATENLQKYFETKKQSEVVVKNYSPSRENLLFVDKKDFWICSRCTLENVRTDVKCSACGMWKPFGKMTNIEKYLAPAPAQKDDWMIKSALTSKDDKVNTNLSTKASETTPAQANYFETPEKKMYVTETVVTETSFNTDSGRNLENDTKMARTFAENVFKAFEMEAKDMKESLTTKDVKESAITTSITVIEPEPTVEEMRRARLARFSQNLEIHQTEQSKLEESGQIKPSNDVAETKIKPNDSQNVEVISAKAPLAKTELVIDINPQPNKFITEEQQKLRKMLKEMKDSLPKRQRSGSEPTRKLSFDKEDIIKEDVELQIKEAPFVAQIQKDTEENVSEKNVSKGAIPKVFKNNAKPIIVDEILKTKPEKEKVIEAYIITKESTYENIKVKKENVETGKPVKVSAASQTQSIKMSSKPPTCPNSQMIPVTVEELSLSLKPSITRVSSFGKGTFELIRAKDFAGISSTATTPDSPLYVNLPATLENLETSQSSTIPTSSPSIQSISSLNSSEEEVLSAQLSDPEGLKDFKATLKQDKHNANTLAINRLLRRLETAIAGGQHIQAARLAKDLARLKVQCSVTRQKKELPPTSRTITADMYVEDQVSHQGPIPLQITPEMTVADLKQKVAQEYEIPSHVQRWILDKQLASDDDVTLEELNITFNGCPMFLYLVAPDGEFDQTLRKAGSRYALSERFQTVPVAEDSDSDITEEEENLKATNAAQIVEVVPDNMWKCPVCTLLNTLDRPGCEACSTERPRSVEPRQQNYLQLMDLDNTDLVPNREQFECLICLVDCPPGDGVILRECLHSFCKQCLAHTIEYNEEAEVKCPFRDSSYSCDIVLQEREVKALVTKEVYEQHLALSVSQAENKIDNAFHCKTPDCRGWCIFEDNVNDFRCPVCKALNCLTCQVIHEGLNCKQYQEQINENSESNTDARRTRDLLEEMVSRGEAMVCPTCQVVLMKKWGCDWLRCSMCKTEICWVTRGPRWGPGGKGDTSAGCQCGVNGIKCHPKCTYCH